VPSFPFFFSSLPIPLVVCPALKRIERMTFNTTRGTYFVPPLFFPFPRHALIDDKASTSRSCPYSPFFFFCSRRPAKFTRYPKVKGDGFWASLRHAPGRGLFLSPLSRFTPYKTRSSADKDEMRRLLKWIAGPRAVAYPFPFFSPSRVFCVSS